MEKIITSVANQMSISKVEKDNFRYTGLDVKALGDSFHIAVQGRWRPGMNLSQILS